MLPSAQTRTCFSQSHPVRLVANTTPELWARAANDAPPMACSPIGARASGALSCTSCVPMRESCARNGSMLALSLGTNR